MCCYALLFGSLMFVIWFCICGCAVVVWYVGVVSLCCNMVLYLWVYYVDVEIGFGNFVEYNGVVMLV